MIKNSYPSFLLEDLFAPIVPFLKGNLTDFSKSNAFGFQNQFMDSLQTIDQFAMRMGELSFTGWKVNPKIRGKYTPDFKQKGVDMKIGLDIAWMAGKRTADKIVMVTGDSDFISPMKYF